MKLETPILQINHIAKKIAPKLKKLGINIVQDLLFYLPFRYQDYSNTVAINNLQIGEEVTIKAKVEIISNKRLFKRRTVMTEAIVYDDTGKLKVIWFGQPFIIRNLQPGDNVYLSGKLTLGKLGAQMVSPSYEKESRQKAKGEKETAHTARIIPIYHLTSGLTNKQLRYLISEILHSDLEVEEWLSEDILEKADLVPLSDAIKAIHYPVDEVDLLQAKKRLKFGELFILQLRSEMIRQSIKSSQAQKIEFKEQKIKEFVDSLSFKLTKAQKVSAWEILQDLKKDRPMNRLLEGDVGSGKTVVAGMALYNTALNNKQAVIMAPTEVLASQHFESFCELLKNTNISIGLLTRTKVRVNQKSKIENQKSFATQKREVIKLIKDGKIDIIIGTHALLSEKVEFKNLGLVIVDEQHRFGVEQRKIIKEKSGDKNTMPHFLSMTATPIPRSFALTLYGDLDLSIIDEMPVGRKPVDTRLVSEDNRDQAYNFIRSQIKQGRQAFVVCPLVEGEGEKKSVLSEYEKLSKKIFKDLNIGYLHGKMKSADKEKIMQDFVNNKINLLVSTSVIEVGVNISNASVMMIEGADRFGLAQLHQFRGRVGRSSHQSFCFLFTETDNEKSLDRLDYFSKTTDGFKVAEYDLESRGPGDVYGKYQSGLPSFKIATLQDKELIKLSRDLARGIDFNKNPSLKEKVKDWEEGVHLE